VGPLNHARWVTLASRLLRLYVASIRPSKGLRRLVNFVLNHYAPMWFFIKLHSSCVDGAKNLFHSVQLARALPSADRDIIKPVIQRNGYWAHPEALLVAMTSDSDQAVRAAAVQVIMQHRSIQAQHPSEVRPYKIPSINFDAETYVDMINWETELVTEPPLLADSSDEVIEGILRSPKEFSNYPVHTQAVEQAVRVVTEASVAVVGQKARHGCICARLAHRKVMPSFCCKKDFRL